MRSIAAAAFLFVQASAFTTQRLTCLRVKYIASQPYCEALADRGRDEPVPWLRDLELTPAAARVVSIFSDKGDSELPRLLEAVQTAINSAKNQAYGGPAVPIEDRDMIVHMRARPGMTGYYWDIASKGVLALLVLYWFSPGWQSDPRRRKISLEEYLRLAVPEVNFEPVASAKGQQFEAVTSLGLSFEDLAAGKYNSNSGSD